MSGTFTIISSKKDYLIFRCVEKEVRTETIPYKKESTVKAVLIHTVEGQAPVMMGLRAVDYRSQKENSCHNLCFSININLSMTRVGWGGGDTSQSRERDDGLMVTLRRLTRNDFENVGSENWRLHNTRFTFTRICSLISYHRHRSHRREYTILRWIWICS